jgi:uncharacterized membrane protein
MRVVVIGGLGNFGARICQRLGLETGIVLALMAGFPLSSPWLVWSMVLYVLVGCCWLPVVWLQSDLTA